MEEGVERGLTTVEALPHVPAVESLHSPLTHASWPSLPSGSAARRSASADDRAPARTARGPDPTERSVSLPLKPMIPTGRSRHINLESWNGNGRAKVMLARRALAMATFGILEISDIALIADRQACNELHWTSLGGLRRMEEESDLIPPMAGPESRRVVAERLRRWSENPGVREIVGALRSGEFVSYTIFGEGQFVAKPDTLLVTIARGLRKSNHRRGLPGCRPLPR